MAAPAHHDLAAFLHVSETLHFARSARALHMSPSALTRCIQRIEGELGHAVFLRDKRTVRLTRAGQILQGHARAQLSAHARLLEALSEEDRAPTGELRIACTVTACHSVLPRLLASCRERYPGVHLQLSTSDASRCWQRLASDEVDVAVVPEPDVLPEDHAFVRLAHTELTFIAPSDGELSRRARGLRKGWKNVPVILPRRGLERERVDGWLEAQALQPEIYAEVEGNEAILAMVALGCGIGIVPELVRAESTLRGRIAPLSVKAPPRGYHVALCTKNRTLGLRTTAALWELAPENAAV